ncbi:MAG: hypothetical protein J6D87_05875 [Clostridia bacterium]|nr:hypothetical protein [Clostridia bacterium]
MKFKYFIILFFILILFSSCAVPFEASMNNPSNSSSVSTEISTDEQYIFENITEETTMTTTGQIYLSEDIKAQIRERYTNPADTGNFSITKIEFIPVYTKTDILSALSVGMSRDEMIACVGEPEVYHVPVEQNYVNYWAYRYNRYYTTDESNITAVTSYAGTGTESDPFRAVISEIWCDGELIDACDTVADEMALGILPTFLAVELHGTDYLISEGLLTEAEAVLYAEEQAVYQASQAELDVETQPTPEIQVSDSEAIQ